MITVGGNLNDLDHEMQPPVHYLLLFGTPVEYNQV